MQYLYYFIPTLDFARGFALVNVDFYYQSIILFSLGNSIYFLNERLPMFFSINGFGIIEKKNLEGIRYKKRDNFFLGYPMSIQRRGLLQKKIYNIAATLILIMDNK